MYKLLWIFIGLLAAVGIGWAMHQDSGYVLINFHHWQIETTVWMAALLTLILFTVFYLLLRLLVRGSQWRRWRQAGRQRRALRFAELAGCDLIEEQWPSAEKYFHKAAGIARRPLLYYVGAAIAAQAQGANARRAEYLRKAHAAAPAAEISLGILQAKLQIQGGQQDEALATLKKLEAIIPQHPVVKKLATH